MRNRSARSARVRREFSAWLGICAIALVTFQEKEKTMAAPADDHLRLQTYLALDPKYRPTPVPTPLDRAVAVAFVNGNVTRMTTPDRMRRLMAVAVFYDLRETARTFAGILTGSESAPDDISRAALALIALAWIGSEAEQAEAQGYFHALQRRANHELHRDLMLEVVEAFGPREGTAAQRQWVQSAIRGLEAEQRRAESAKDVRAARLAAEKINALTEYLSIELARVEREFERRRGISAQEPPLQVQPLVDLAVAAARGSTPQLLHWSSMRLLRLSGALHPQIADEFRRRAEALVTDDNALFRARALRAAEYFGTSLSELERQAAPSESDPGVDPLVLRPSWFLAAAPA